VRLRFGARKRARITLRALGGIDLGAYLRAFALLVRNPQIVLAPLLASITGVLLQLVIPGDNGDFISSANSGIAGLISQLIGSFGLAVAMIVADAAWRRGKAPFDDAWDDARRKAGDILIAALGLNFVVYVAGLIGGFAGGPGSIVLSLVATYFFIYTLPAAAFGGVPGGAALQVSLERARTAIAPTLLVTLVYVLGTLLVPSLIFAALLPVLLNALEALGPHATSPFVLDVVPRLVIALITAVVSSYVALVLAKTYADVSFGRRW
jgi:hypothetical protein